jgi:hypothetical protein
VTEKSNRRGIVAQEPRLVRGNAAFQSIYDLDFLLASILTQIMREGSNSEGLLC